MADVLESDGLIRYDDNPRHRRARLVTLTASGRAALEGIQAAQRPWADSLGARVGERELVRANRVLDRALEELSARRAR